MSELTDFSGYPMVVAISEQMLNRQFSRIFGTVGSFDFLPWEIKDEKGLWHLTVTRFAAPEVDFDTQVIDGCRLKMKVIDGSFRTWSVDTRGAIPKVKETPLSLDDVTIIITTQVSAVKHNHWDQRYAEVQATFTDLETTRNVELSLSRQLETSIGTPVKTSVARVLAEQLDSRAGEHPLQAVFGKVRLPDVPSADHWYEEMKPSAFTYSTTVVRDSHLRYQYGLLNVLILVDGNQKFPSGGTAGQVATPLAGPGGARLVVSDGTLLDRYAKQVVERKWPGIELNLDRGREGERNARLSLAKTFQFGCLVNGRSRSAYLVLCNVSVSDGGIVLEARYNTSAYGVFEDEAVTVSLSERVNLDLAAIDLPGETIWRYGRRYLDDHLYVDAEYR
jgi:hypothetical protein